MYKGEKKKLFIEQRSQTLIQAATILLGVLYDFHATNMVEGRFSSCRGCRQSPTSQFETPWRNMQGSNSKCNVC